MRIEFRYYMVPMEPIASRGSAGTLLLPGDGWRVHKTEMEPRTQSMFVVLSREIFEGTSEG